MVPEWKPVQNLKTGMYYDFKLRNGTIVYCGMYKNNRFADRYGFPISRPIFYKEHATYKCKLEA